MKVVIPMAGYGKRLRPHTYSRPKPLINVAGQPLVKHVIDSLEGLDVDEYIFVVGYLGAQIEEYISANCDVKASFVTQHEMVGQAHAVYLARDLLEGPTIVLFADTLFKADLDPIKRAGNADALVYVKEVDDPRRFGVVALDDEGRVTRFIEKPDSMDIRQAVIGFYYVSDAARLMGAIETQMERKQMTKGEFFIADAFQIMIDEGAIFRTQPVDVWLDCGKPETVLETNRYLLANGLDNSDQLTGNSVTVIPPVNIHPDAVFDHAIIGPYATVAADCQVSYSIIRNSIIDTGAVVEYALLDRSLIGRDARVVGQYSALNVGDESSIVGFS
ncbi:MAG: NTP transferase domain-containing protein [Anaerolineae bacterium]|nr:NTP transferase domain-containing protein [Anaerolineae bacterium]